MLDVIIVEFFILDFYGKLVARLYKFRHLSGLSPTIAWI